MKILLLVSALAVCLFVTACDSMHSTTQTPGPTSGVKSHSTHAGNSEGAASSQR